MGPRARADVDAVAVADGVEPDSLGDADYLYLVLQHADLLHVVDALRVAVGLADDLLLVNAHAHHLDYVLRNTDALEHSDALQHAVGVGHTCAL